VSAPRRRSCVALPDPAARIATVTRMTVPGGHVRSALFVDFDNVFSNLGGPAAPAARTFAEEPQRWLMWMENEMGHVVSGADERTERRVLLRNCYLNPERFGRFRSAFTRNAFRVVDCPSMTNQGKNSADIYMVLDIVDALNHSTRFDEFILLSADADFTPVMTRLRAHDRRTVLLASGPSASALRNACDFAIPVEIFKEEALGGDPGTERQLTVADQPPGPVDPAILVAQMREALSEVVEAASLPIPLATAAQRVLDAAPEALNSGWGGYSTFRKFVESCAGEQLQISGPQPGYLLDPTRHQSLEGVLDARDLPERFRGLAVRLNRVSVPALTPDAYRQVFAQVSLVARQNPPVGESDTERQVMEAVTAQRIAVTATAVRFVLKGLHLAKVDRREGNPLELADAFARNLVDHCERRGMSLSDPDRELLLEWVGAS
jgi:hypothetical protein